MKFWEKFDDPQRKGLKWSVFCALVVLAGGVRLYRLDQGLWYDEIISAILFFRAPWPELLTFMPLPNHHPLYSLFAKLCLLSFGEKEWALRLPAYVAGSLTPGLLFFFCRRYVDGLTGALSGLFLCFAMWPVWWSQDARGYSFLILFSLAATYLFLLLCEKADRRLIAVYAAVAAAAIYSHLFAAAVIGTHLVVAFFFMTQKREGWKRLLAATSVGLFVSLLLYLPLLADFYRFVFKEGTITTGRSMNFAFLGRLLTAWSGGYGRPLLSLVVLLPAGGGAVAMFRKKPLLASLVVLPLLAGFLASLVTGTFVFHRFYSYGIWGLYMFCGFGLSLLIAGRKSSLRWSAAVVAVLIIAVLGYTLSDYYRKDKQAIRRAAEWAEADHPYEKVIALGLVSKVYFYYSPGSRLYERHRDLSADDTTNSVIVTSFEWSVSPHNRDILERKCRLEKFFPSAGPPELHVRAYYCK